VGTIFLSVGLIRIINYQLTSTHHQGLEAGILYWHFVDAVWIFLFIAVYYWGGSDSLNLDFKESSFLFLITSKFSNIKIKLWLILEKIKNFLLTNKNKILFIIILLTIFFLIKQMDIFKNLSLLSQIKLFFILIFFFLILCFYYENLNKQYKNNKLLESSSSGAARNFGRWLSAFATAITIDQYFSKLEQDPASYRFHQQIVAQKDSVIEELRNDSEKSENERNWMVGTISLFKEKMDAYQGCVNRYRSIEKKIDSLQEKLAATINPKERYDILQEINGLRALKPATELAIDMSASILNEYKKTFSDRFRKSFIADDFWGLIEKYKEYLTTLNVHQLGALVNLLISGVILSCIISITFIFTGEFLIKRFDLENRYPKLAKFIKLRRKFQNFYFIINILTITFFLSMQIYVDIVVLTM
jgi:hypothetical protein